MSRGNSILLELAKTNNRKNKKNVIIMIAAIAFVILGIFSIFTLTMGKISIDSLKITRGNGTAASGMLLNAKEEHFLKLKNLSYIEKTGSVKEAGIWLENNEQAALLLVSDEVTFQNFFKQAYTNIIGEYPKDSNEVMMPLSLLEKMGVQNPQIGMNISVPVLWNDWTMNEHGASVHNMRLSGFFTEYVNTADKVLPVYLSNAFLEKAGVAKYPVNVQFTTKGFGYSRDDIEARIYSDISIGERQRVVGIDSAVYESWERMLGGYGIALLCGSILLLSMFLLIYNLMVISMSGHLSRIQIMKTLGMTKKQLTKMLRIQNIQIIGSGCCLGMLLSAVLGYWVYPYVITNLYLKGLGEIDHMKLFSWKMCLGIVLLVFWMAWFAAYRSNNMLKSEKKSVQKTFTRRKQKIREGKDPFYIFRLAWHNVTRIRKRFWLTISTITIGCIVAISSIVISKGVDLKNQLELNPDFCISVSESIMQEYQWEWDEQEREAFCFISDHMIEDIANLAGISEKEMTTVEGGFGSFEHTDEVFRPLVEASSGNVKGNTGATVQSVDNETLEILEKYASDFNKKIDGDSLISGNGILILHNHMLSPQQEEDANQLIGKLMYISNIDHHLGENFVCSGYLDITDKNFPQIDMTWNRNYTNYFIASEETFQKMEFEKMVFNISFNVDKQKEREIKEALLQYIQEKNSNALMDYFEISANSDMIQEHADYLTVSRTIMALISTALLFIAVMNYVNTLISGMLVRKNEFSIMKSIGMEQNQIWGMLTCEGLCYSFVTILGILSLGNVIIYLLSKAISKRLTYFVFYYPLKELGGIVIVLTIFCIVFPVLLYKKTASKNTVEEMKR